MLEGCGLLRGMDAFHKLGNETRVFPEMGCA